MRVTSEHSGRPARLTTQEETAAIGELLERLHLFAHATGADAGDDVVRHFDTRLRLLQERKEIAARGG